MSIKYKYEPSTYYTDNRIDVFANGVPIGTLQSTKAAPEQLDWIPDDRVHNIKFQFRNEETFIAVVKELKRYKDENGYKYLGIWSLNHGYVESISKNWLEKAGFKKLPGTHPECMYLE